MKILVFALGIFVSLHTMGQADSVMAYVPYDEDPFHPSIELLEALTVTPFSKLTVDSMQGRDIKRWNFFYEYQPFNGWAYDHEQAPASSLKGRYYKIENGAVTWELSIFKNGNLRQDFHYKNRHPTGRQNLWNEDGSPLLEAEFNENGLLHGTVKSFDSQGKIIASSRYENGILKESTKYDEQGNPMEEAPE